ncbi:MULTISPECIES: acetylornithine deacetylase [Arthrobacter]|uniref:Acetylornithine deacetylase n=1 Tax=Arthrobacter sunyaminii TaxID=2816859 RepID=A0A975PEF8_9MICC|nr:MULTISPECIES: acetylornithine deacetylase [Arthrobacter]MBO0907464.1 acetylornithine deacetylase [Arthrobacter sunyaminii]QWQ35042.1 acetylornithine deacetylase [Arthrobacter sunyaminii]
MSPTPSDATLEEITRLINFETVSRDSNLPLIEYVGERLKALGIESKLVHDATGQKANLLATIPAGDGTRTGGIVLSGHTDVVPVDGQDWGSDPFTPEIRDGKLYARGACDMKSFVGVVMAKLDSIVAAELSEPIHLAFSYDEEVGCIGAVGLVEAITAEGLKPRGAIVGEPTSMRVVRGHKSVNVIKVDFHGIAAHSSLTPQGVNAIAAAADFAAFVDAKAEKFAGAGASDEAFIVPYTTATVNQIQGGIAVNTIPAACTLHFEFRSIADDDPVELIEEFRAEALRIEALMKERNPKARVDFTVLAQTPGLDTPEEDSIVSLASELGGTPSPDKVTYGTEAGLFSNAGIPTVVCGPGDIAQAHAPDEFIALEQIAACESFIDNLVEALTAQSANPQPTPTGSLS